MSIPVSPAPDRHQILEGFVRSLLRRARSCCELCEGAVVGLSPWEVPPLRTEPEMARTLLLCARCRAGLEDPEADLSAWEFLRGSAWADAPAVQVTSVRALRRAAGSGAAWAAATLEGLYLPPDVDAWLDET
jgi:protein PhnA